MAIIETKKRRSSNTFYSTITVEFAFTRSAIKRSLSCVVLSMIVGVFNAAAMVNWSIFRVKYDSNYQTFHHLGCSFHFGVRDRSGGSARAQRLLALPPVLSGASNSGNTEIGRDGSLQREPPTSNLKHPPFDYRPASSPNFSP